MADFRDQLLERIKSGSTAEVLALLRKSDVDPCHFIGKYRSTLLHLAAEHGHKDLTQHLIDLEADVNAQNNIGETPLTLAVKHEYEEVVKVLLKANADIFLPDIFGQSTLKRAFDEMDGMQENIRWLILDTVTTDFVRNSSYVQMPGFHDDYPLYNFMILKNYEIVKFLVEMGSRIDAVHPLTGTTALHEAVKHLNLEIVKLLLERGANWFVVDELNVMPIDYLLLNVDPDLYEEFKNFNIDVNFFDFDRRTLLHRVVGRGNPIAVQFLLKQGANIHAKDRENLTPLHAAIDPFQHRDPIHREVNGLSGDYRTSGRLECIALLLKSGADPQIFTRDIRKQQFEVFDNPTGRDRACELARPVLGHLALQEACGRTIERFMLHEIGEHQNLKTIFDSSKRQLKQMKGIKLDESMTLFDFMMVERVSQYAQNETLVSNLTSAMKESRYGLYYHNMLYQRFLKLTTLFAVNEVFVKFHDASVFHIAGKIVDYL